MNAVEVAAKYASSIDTINSLRNMKMILQNGKKNMVGKVEKKKEIETGDDESPYAEGRYLELIASLPLPQLCVGYPFFNT